MLGSATNIEVKRGYNQYSENYSGQVYYFAHFANGGALNQALQIYTMNRAKFPSLREWRVERKGTAKSRARRGLANSNSFAMGAVAGRGYQALQGNLGWPGLSWK
jgi:hypothetical protein